MALSPVAVLLMSGCYVSMDSGLYPEAKLVKKASLVREWAGDGADLALKKNDAFSATALMLEYFQCPSDGIQKKSGIGTWSTIEDGDSTSLMLDFEDGCSATLWTGESEGKTVLWATQADENEVLILK